MAPKKAAPKKKKQEDDDDALLAQQEQLVAAENAKLAELDKIAKAKAAEKAKEELKLRKEQDVAKALIAASRPPIFIDEVAATIIRLSHQANWSAQASTLPHHQMSSPCWIAYVLHNFLFLIVESKERRLALRTPTCTSPTSGEPISKFELHEDPDAMHAWNVITTVSGGVYSIDLTVEQFLPTGRFGYKHDGRSEDGWFPVASPSRLLVIATGAPLRGSTATDMGILPPGGGVVDLQEGVPEGTYRNYMRFLSDANQSRFSKMKPEEKKTAEILFKTRAVPQWLELHEKLLVEFLA